MSMAAAIAGAALSLAGKAVGNGMKKASDIYKGEEDKDKEEEIDTSQESDQIKKEAIKEVAKACSDERLKEIYGESIDDKIIENFAKISAIDFKYKDEAVKEYDGDYGVDSNNHIGVTAQELQDNPATEGTVETNENGDLVVDTRHLAFADTAAIAELSRRVLALEQIVKELQK